MGWERSYDRGGNAIAQRSLHDAKDSQRYAYDAAARLTAFSRGDFATGSLDPGSAAYCDAPTAGTWGDLARAQEWHLDGLGNWRTFVQKAGTAGAQPVSEARVDNPFNMALIRHNSHSPPLWVEDSMQERYAICRCARRIDEKKIEV